MFAQSLTDDEAMEVATVYPAWAAGKTYKTNDIVTYGENAVDDPQLYRCVQTHISQGDWRPDATPSLWTTIGLAPDNIPVWSQPTGAHDGYMTGDKVHYPTADDAVWESTMDYNVYEPGVFGWIAL